jgi:hypothetical protein
MKGSEHQIAVIVPHPTRHTPLATVGTAAASVDRGHGRGQGHTRIVNDDEGLHQLADNDLQRIAIRTQIPTTIAEVQGHTPEVDRIQDAVELGHLLVLTALGRQVDRTPVDIAIQKATQAIEKVATDGRFVRGIPAVNRPVKILRIAHPKLRLNLC